MNNPFPSIANLAGPATPITGCYFPDWLNRDDHPAGTRVMVLYSPDHCMRAFEAGQVVTLSDCWAGLALRRAMNEQQRVVGARFQDIEVLNDESPSRSLPSVAMPHSALSVMTGSL